MNEKLRNWWNSEKSKIQYKSVLFVTPTPGAELAKEIQTRLAELNKNSLEQVKIVEKGGLKVKDILGTKNPFKSSKCEQVTCPICSDSEYIQGNSFNSIPCNTNNVGYRWLCVNCEEKEKIRVYEGETGRSARLRGLEHVKELEKKAAKSVLFKHANNEHKNEAVKFRMEITKSFKDALSRQANEAVRISSRTSQQLLNSKSEFNHPPITRVAVESKDPVSGSRIRIL